MNKKKCNIMEYAEKLPPIIARKDIQSILGNCISQKTLANADSCGKGPEIKFKVGRTVVYDTVSLLEWLNNKAK